MSDYLPICLGVIGAGIVLSLGFALTFLLSTIAREKDKAKYQKGGPGK